MNILTCRAHFHHRRKILFGIQRLNLRNYHNENYDVAIVGGGIVGMATAQELLARDSSLKCILLEKENELAKHQTGHNSGVIHAGMYYTPGSLRAKLCVEGLDLIYQFCKEYNVPCKRIGKIVVATTNDEVSYLQWLYDRGQENNVKGLSLMSGNDIKQLEPHCQGVAALHSPNTGIIDYADVTRMCGKIFESRGGTIVKNYEVIDFKYSNVNKPDEKDLKQQIHSLVLPRERIQEFSTVSRGSVAVSVFSCLGHTYPVQVLGRNKPPISCRYVITCSGMYSDELAMLTGCHYEPKIVPIRGDYFTLKPERSYLVRGNIYPVPDPTFPFLGFHFTPRMDGNIWMGPNAILAFKKEGYGRFDFNLKDTVSSLSYRGFRNLLLKHWKFAFNELYDTFRVQRIVSKLQKLVPEIQLSDIERGPCGIRAQALASDGDLVDDFVFDFGVGELGERFLHIRNAPSPAATSSLAIARMVVDKFQKDVRRK